MGNEAESIHEEFTDETPNAADGADLNDNEPVVAAEEGGDHGDVLDESVAKAEPETKEEPAAEPEPEAKAEETEKTVPYGALHAEREMRKEVQGQLLETRQMLGQMQGLKEQLDELRKGKAEDTSQAEREAQEREFEEDPIGALRKQQEALQERLDGQAKETETQTKEQEEQQKQFNDFMTDVTSQVAEFEKDHPDYPQAFKHLMDLRVEEYKAMGITDPNQLQMAFDREAIALAQGAIQRGKNPAEVAYDMAKVRGYTKTDAPAKEEKPEGESLEKQMERLERGNEASKSLNGGNNTDTEAGVTLSEISTMSDKEFDAMWAKMEDASIYE